MADSKNMWKFALPKFQFSCAVSSSTESASGCPLGVRCSAGVSGGGVTSPSVVLAEGWSHAAQWFYREYHQLGIGSAPARDAPGWVSVSLKAIKMQIEILSPYLQWVFLGSWKNSSDLQHCLQGKCASNTCTFTFFPNRRQKYTPQIYPLLGREEKKEIE